MTFLLVVSHGRESDDDRNPIYVVGDNGAVGCGVLPAE